MRANTDNVVAHRTGCLLGDVGQHCNDLTIVLRRLACLGQLRVGVNHARGGERVEVC